jgi:hypothetical protein
MIRFWIYSLRKCNLDPEAEPGLHVEQYSQEPGRESIWMPLTGECTGRMCSCTHSMLPSHDKNEILPFATTWMSLQDIVLAFIFNACKAALLCLKTRVAESPWYVNLQVLDFTPIFPRELPPALWGSWNPRVSVSTLFPPLVALPSRRGLCILFI